MVMQQKNRAIEMWRFIVALLILVYHFKRYDQNLGYVPFYGGYLGNIFFFVLGGFLLMQHFERNEYTREEKRRSLPTRKDCRTVFGLKVSSRISAPLLFLVAYRRRQDLLWYKHGERDLL